MKITYEVSDGYVGGSAPQHFDFPDSEIADCETIDEAETLIWEAIQDDFEQKVSPAFNFSKIKNAVARLIQDRKDDEARENQEMDQQP